MKVSVIIPTLNEEKRIGSLVAYLLEKGGEDLEEVIVVDGGSADGTAAAARKSGAEVIVSSKARRSAQMNLGARAAGGAVLYFLHADVFPPADFASRVLAAIGPGSRAGCFRRKLNSRKRFLHLVSAASRFRGAMFRGGDASLYVTKELFQQVGAFDENLAIMEDFEILRRLRRETRFRLIPSFVVASDRKHRENNPFLVNFANALVFTMYYLGFSQKALMTTYRRLVPQTRFRK